MTPFEAFNWDGGSEMEHLQMVRRCGVEAQRELARTYDWGMYPEAVIGWITAQRGIDLATALSAFVNGDPMRFNYLSKRDVPAAHRGVCRLLDNIVLRVNSGFYLPDPAMDVLHARKMQKWMDYQREDAAESRLGRWAFDCSIVGGVLALTQKTIDLPEQSTALKDDAIAWSKPLRGILQRTKENQALTS